MRKRHTVPRPCQNCGRFSTKPMSFRRCVACHQHFYVHGIDRPESLWNKDRSRPPGEFEMQEIPSQPGYRISRCGTLVESAFGCGEGFKGTIENPVWQRRVLRLNTAGYWSVKLRDSTGRSRVRTVHQLVMEAFVGPRPEGMEVCHCDGIKTNNHADNLRYDTKQGNMLDKVKHGTNFSVKGEDHPRTCFTEADVVGIRKRLANGAVAAAIAREYGVTPQAIFAIRHGKSWAHIQEVKANGI